MKKIWENIKHINRQRNLKTKILKNKLRVFLISLRKRQAKTSIPSQYESVLIFMHTNGLGDAIVTSGFIDILRKNNKKVYIIAERRISFLFDELITVDGLIDYNKKNFSDFKRKTKGYQFDIIIDFSDMDGTVIDRLKTLSVLKHKHAIGFNQNKKTMYDTNIIYNQNKHISDRMLYVLSLLNITTNNYQYALHIPDYIHNSVNTFLTEKVENKKLIIFNPFASEIYRSMTSTQVYSLLQYMNRISDCKIIVFDVDKCLNLSQYSNILENPSNLFVHAAELVKQADLIITVDTSIVHLAQAFNKNLIAIYNNRLFNKRFVNNIVWGPNYPLATQLTTNEHLNTESGDPMCNLDIQIIINQLKKIF